MDSIFDQYHSPQYGSLEKELMRSARKKKDSRPLHGINPLAGAALPIFRKIIDLQKATILPDIGKLREELIGEVELFEKTALDQGIENSHITATHYILCAVIDEMVATTPWGRESDWSSESLLTLCHNENDGGEKFFTLLERLLNNPASYIALLEVMYLALAIGFEGVYRVTLTGRSDVESIRNNLYRQIRIIRGDPPYGLTFGEGAKSSAKGGILRRSSLRFHLILIGFVLTMVYGVFSFILGKEEGEALHTIQRNTISITENKSKQEQQNTENGDRDD